MKGRLRLDDHALEFPDRIAAFGALAHHAGIAFQRRQRLAAIRPFRRLIQIEMIERLAAGARLEERARDVHHFWSIGAFVEQRRAADGAEAAHGA